MYPDEKILDEGRMALSYKLDTILTYYDNSSLYVTDIMKAFESLAVFSWTTRP